MLYFYHSVAGRVFLFPCCKEMVKKMLGDKRENQLNGLKEGRKFEK